MSPADRRARIWIGACLLPALAVGMPPVLAENASIEAGERIYRDGVLASGAPLEGIVGKDVVLRAAHAACANCHRRSGYGVSEGDRVVPPITADFLFRDKQVQDRNLFAPATGSVRSDSPFTRRAYDDAALQRLLRDGVHRSGRILDAPMPRYALADSDLASLIAYLRTLSATPPAGVSETEMHFATLVTDGVPDRQRQALLGVMDSFFRDKNAETRGETTRRAQRVVMGHGRAYRAYHKWRLHVWELKGAPSTWSQQIERYYRQQPVYAVLGGVGRGSWQAVQASCERLELPCLFPNNEQAAPLEGSYFSVYFTAGVRQEAQVLAQALIRHASAAAQRLVQVYRQQDSGEVAALALRQALANTPGVDLQDRVLNDANAGDADFWKSLLIGNQDVIVLWLRDEDLAHFPASPGSARLPLYLSGSLVDDPARVVPAAWRSQTRVILLRDLPGAWQERRAHVTSWLSAHQLALSDEAIQSNTYWVLSLATRAITHMREYISRDYLIERIEHMVQVGAWPSIYPRLSLGPGQRIASRGGMLVSLQADGSLSASDARILPDISAVP